MLFLHIIVGRLLFRLVEKMIDRISFLKTMIERLRRLSAMEKKLMLAFIENKNVKASRLISLGKSYGISAMNMYNILMMLIEKNLIIPIVYFPKDVGALITRVPFANLFLSFDEVLDIRSLPRRWRDKLSGSINELKRACEDILSEIGYYSRPSTRLGGRELWVTLKKFYETTSTSRIAKYLNSLYDIVVPEETFDKYIIRMLSYSLLAFWTIYFVATLHKDGSLLSEGYLHHMGEIIQIMRENMDRIKISQSKDFRSLLSEKYNDVMLFVCESIKEAEFSGVSIEEKSRDLLEKLEKMGSVLIMIDRNNEEKVVKTMEKAKGILQ